jgi:hypothetical protein
MHAEHCGQITPLGQTCTRCLCIAYTNPAQTFNDKNEALNLLCDRLCGLVVRVPGYRSIVPRFDSRHYQTLWEVVGLERGPLSLVSTIEELTELYVYQKISVCPVGTNRIFKYCLERNNRLCGLVVRVVGYRSIVPRFDSRHYQILWVVVGLERGPLSLVSTTEELTELYVYQRSSVCPVRY